MDEVADLAARLDGLVFAEVTTDQVTARIIDAGSGECLADAKADGPLDQVFDLQDRIVSQFTDALGGLVERRAELPELGRRSREYVERVHAHTAVARRMLEIYERVMPDSS